MKLLTTFFILTALSVFAQDDKQAPKPFMVTKNVEVVAVMPGGKLELQAKYTWEDAAYALLKTATDTDMQRMMCLKQLEDLKPKAPKK